jgi:predicted metal-binding protein
LICATRDSRKLEKADEDGSNDEYLGKMYSTLDKISEDVTEQNEGESFPISRIMPMATTSREVAIAFRNALRWKENGGVSPRPDKA